MASWIVPALNMATQIGSRLLSAKTARENVEKTNRARMELAQYQLSKNKEMWELMKDYNTPAKQMQRFEEAGLNPNLIYGQGTPGNVQTSPTFQAPQIDYRGRPSMAAQGMIGAYQGVRQGMELNQLSQNVAQAEVATWLAQETKWFKKRTQQAGMNAAINQAEGSHIRNTISMIEERIKNVKASFWEKGISPNDATYIRVGMKVLEALGVSPGKIEGLLDELPKDALENIITN